MSTKTKLNRRQFLQGLGVGSTALLVAACAQPAPTAAPAPAAKAEPTKAPAAAAAKAPEPTKAPAAKEAITFTYWVGLNGNVAATMKSYNEIAAYQEIEKRTGVHIDFQHPTVGQDAEQFNLMMASGKYPDMIEYGWLGVPGGPAKAIKDGVIVRLNDAIKQNGASLMKWLTDNPTWAKQVVTDEGDMYVFPFLRSHPHLLTYTGPQIRADWLKKLNLNVPSTLDEWHDMLVAFKTKDPDASLVELPFSPAINATKMGAFNNHAFVGAYGLTVGYFQDQGTVKYGPLQPEFKDFLTLMSGWFKEGLVDPDFPAADTKMMDAKITGGQLGSFVHLTGSGMGRILQLVQPKNPTFDLAPAPYPVLKAGEKPQLGQRDNNFPGNGTAITTACKRVAEAAKWLDYKYSPEGHMLSNFGIEGVSYKLEGDYPRYTDAVMKPPEGQTLAQGLAKYMFSNFGGPFVQDLRYMDQYVPMPQQQAGLKVWTQPTNSKLMPPVTPTADESKKFASVMSNVNTRYEEAVIKIITGADAVGNWDKVLAEFKQMGIEDALKIQQAALERFNKRA
jgi:putative aldouronate transport system substrate-binding protein